MKKMLFVILLVLAVCVIFMGCQKTETPGTDTPTTNGATETTAVDDTVYEIKYAYFGSESNPLSVAQLESFEWAEEQSNGRLKYTAYFGGTILSASDQIQGTTDGIVDMSLQNCSMMNEMFNLNTVMNLPTSAQMPDRYTAMEVLSELIFEVPEMNQELNDSNLTWLYAQATGGYNIHSTTSVKTVDDLKNLKIEVSGYAVNYFSQLGASPTSLGAMDYYTGASTNLVQAQCTHWTVLDLYDMDEIFTHHTLFASPEAEDEIDFCGGGLYINTMCNLMNLDTWNSLPADLQDIVLQAAKQAGYGATAGDAPYIEAAKTFTKDRGDEFVYIYGDQDRKPWVDAMASTIDSWVANAEAAGFANAKDIYDQFCTKMGEASMTK